MTASAQGIDISSFQAVYTVEELRKYSFAFFRATVGTTDTDPNLPANWANGKAAGIHRGAYHELTALTAVASQAAHFIAVVKARGVEPGDMLAVVSSDYAGITAEAVVEFCKTVAAEFPHCPVLVYSDVSFLPSLNADDADRYPLWIAYYSGKAPASVAPWKSWKFWQWQGITAPDNDAYNGTAAELQAWLDTYLPVPLPPADPEYGPPLHLTARPGHTTVALAWDRPAAVSGLPAASFFQVFIYRGTKCDTSTIVDSYPRDVGNVTEYQGGSLEERTEYTAHVVAGGAGGSHEKPYTYASVTFTTGG